MQNLANKALNFFQVIRSKFARKRAVPQHILFQDFFHCEKTVGILGFDFLTDHNTLLNKWIKINSLVFQVVMALIFIAEIISFVMSIQQNLFYVAIENALQDAGFLVVMMKVYVICHHNRAKFDEIFEKLDKHFPHYGVDQLVYKSQRYIDVLKRFEIIYYVTFAATTSIFVFMPFLHQIYGSATSTVVEWSPIYPLILPFNQHPPMVFAFMWIIESWSFLLTGYYVVCSDLLFVSLVQTLAMEFDILSQIISEIDMADGEEEAIKELKKLVDIQQELIEVSEKLNEIFSPLLLINVFGSITTLCTASFLAVVNII